ncbi:DoxX family protein [Candidatus Pacebacteria bacterium]|nr:DoxX family protein [Candidatus Paceibacterota bacterium]
MNLLQKTDAYLAPAGRIIMGAFFVLAGISKMTDIAGTAAYIDAVGLPASTFLAMAGMAIEVGVGGALLIGYKPRIAALVLAGFVLFISFPFHGPGLWAENPLEQIMFMKNIAIVAGLLFMAAHAGSFANGTPTYEENSKDPIAAL